MSHTKEQEMISAMKELGSYTATDIQVSGELNKRNYFSEVGNGVVIQPFYTIAENISMSVDYAIQKVLGYGVPYFAATKTYLNAMTWGNLVATAIDKSAALSQYTKAGMAGLGGLGQVSWWDNYGPVILQIIGSAATIGGQAWQQSVTRDQINQKITTPITTGGTQADATRIAQQLITSGISQAEAQARANNIVFGTPLPDWVNAGKTPPSGLPSWALPLGIGVLAYSLLKGRQ
jgi:hypothetical protein